MKIDKVNMRRRNLLVAPFTATWAATLGWLLWPVQRAFAAQKATLIAKQVERLPDEPGDPLWGDTELLEVPLAPQAVVKPRTFEAAVKTLRVRALYDQERLAFQLEWEDPRRDAIREGVSAFRDAVAIEFPAVPGTGIPYFGMGEPDRPVTIYQWKSDWQSGTAKDVEEKYPHMAVDWYPFSGREPNEIALASDYGKEGADKAFHTSWWVGNPLADPELQAQGPIEKLRAEGFGTLTPVTPSQQDGLGKGLWKDGEWKILISIPLRQEAFHFERGHTIPLAFAAWEGLAAERGAEKAVSTWYFLGLEQPVGGFALAAPLLAIIGAAAAEAWGLRWLRSKDRDNVNRDNGEN
jgi:hypothetical protein